MVTAPEPVPTWVPYRVAFDVVDGEARPDGYILDWPSVAGTTLTPAELTISTTEGVASAEYPGPLGLGGPWVFGTEQTVVVPVSCTEAHHEATLQQGGVLALGPSVVEEGEGPCEDDGPGLDAAWLLAIMPLSHAGPPSFQGTWPQLFWEDGQLVAVGHVDESVILVPELTPEVPGPKVLELSAVPQTELDQLPSVPGWDPAQPPASATPDEVMGTIWHLLDHRGLEPQKGAPALTFDGSSWSVTVCGQTRSAPGALEDGVITLDGAFADAGSVAGAPCPEQPWADLAAWETFLASEPLVVPATDGEVRSIALAGTYEP